MSFREAFCRQTGCSLDDYGFEVYRRCARARNRWLLRLAWAIEPPAVALSKRLLNKLCNVNRNDLVEDYINEFHERLEERGGKSSPFRVSGRSLTKLFREVMRRESPDYKAVAD